MKSDPIAAYHESGHCAIALRHGWAVRAVALTPSGAGLTDAGYCQLAGDWEEVLQADPVKVLIYTLSGRAAEKRFIGHTSSRDAQDRETATAIATMIVHDGEHMWDPKVQARAQATLRTCATLADALMLDPVVWREVECIAAALRRQRRLTGDDLRTLLRERR